MLSVKQIAKPVKVKNPRSGKKEMQALSLKHHGLFYGNSPWKSNMISNEKVAEYLKFHMNKGEKVRDKLVDQLDTTAEEVQDLEVVDIKCEADTHIVAEFRLKKSAKRINLDPSHFLIKADYKPNDKDAPHRIYDIASEFRAILDDFFDNLTRRILDMENLPINPDYEGLTHGYDENNTPYVAYQENGEMFEYLRDPIPVEEFMNMWWHYTQVETKKKAIELNKPYTSKEGKKHLKNCVISFADGALDIINLEDYSEEVQTVINDIIDHFTIAGGLE
jgi:hypothetical protein